MAIIVRGAYWGARSVSAVHCFYKGGNELVREDATFLELDEKYFETLRHGNSMVAYKFLEHMRRALVKRLRITNQKLARLHYNNILKPK